MKILFLLHSYSGYSRGGAELQIKYIAEYLNKKGFEIHYLFLHSDTKNSRDEYIHLYSIKKSILGEKSLGKLFYYRKVLNRIREIKPDIIYHRNLSNFVLPAIRYSKTTNCKTVIHLASSIDVERSLKFNKMIIRNSIDLYGKQKALKKSDYIIAQAKYQDELLEKNFNRRVDLVLSNVHPIPRERIEKGKKVKILWVANFKELKQPHLFIELAKRFESDVEFIMIGRNPKGLNSKINNLNYLGELSVDEVNNCLSHAHIFVNTSLYEGFPNTFIQAWMREVPVVSLNVNPDFILTKNHIGFHSKTFEQMVLDVKKLIDNQKLRAEMGKSARAYSLKKYSMRNIEHIIELINL